MALNFSSSVPDKLYTQENFAGVDFSTQPSKVSPKRSPESKNMLINQNGYVEKRTGYRRVFEGATDESGNAVGGNINGIFEYVCAGNGTTYNFVHIADKLYKYELDDGQMVIKSLMLEGLKDKKSRGFAFGGDFYIIGAGYIKVGYDEFTKNICYGFVNKACSVADKLSAPLALGISKGDTFSYAGGYECSSENIYKKIKLSWHRFVQGESEKFYVAPPEYVNEVRVEAVGINRNLGDYDGEDAPSGTYTTGSDEGGVYVYFNGNLATGDAAVYFFVTYNSFVYAPTVVTGRSSVRVHNDGSVYGDPRYTGEVLEGANLASGIRKIDFYIDKSNSTNTESYRLYTGAKSGRILRIWKNGSLVQVYNNNIYLDSLQYVGVYAGFVSHGDVITVEFVQADSDYSIIDGCNIYTLYGGSNDTRAFLAGNEKYPARDYASGLYDATYFSDLMYTDVGSEASAIIGYHKLYSNLIIIKDGIGNDSTQYLRSFSLTTDENGNTSAVFSVKQGSASYPAANASSLKTVGSTPMFLGYDGVFALQGTNVENQNNTVRVSQTIDERLKKEADFENAVCAQYDKKYYMFFGDHAYICSPEMGYEWFYFDSLPKVKCVWIKDKTMYFGAEDGIVYRFMSADEIGAYYDDVGVDGSTVNAKAIEAVWEMPQTTLGEYANYKTIRNCYITCMPHNRSSVEVYYNTNEDWREWVLAENIDLFSFEDIDFGRFTFNSISAPFVFATGVKVKNVYVFGLRLENKVAGEPFGFLALSIKYRTGKYVK